MDGGDNNKWLNKYNARIIMAEQKMGNGLQIELMSVQKTSLKISLDIIFSVHLTQYGTPDNCIKS